jgi:hypothetical protein
MVNKCCAPSYIPSNEDNYKLLIEKMDKIINLLEHQTDYMTNGIY